MCGGMCVGVVCVCSGMCAGVVCVCVYVVVCDVGYALCICAVGCCDDSSLHETAERQCFGAL